MKKVIVILMIAALVLAGCGGEKKDSAGKEVLKIGILQLVEHPALDASREGFLTAMKDLGYIEGTNFQVEYLNAQGDQSNLIPMAKKLIAGNPQLILAIATPPLQVLASETTQIPILMTAITDPVAANVVKSMEKPGTNATGTSNQGPVKEQLEMMKQIFPDATRLGVIYNSGEVNSQVQVKRVKEHYQAAGFTEIIEASVASTSEIMLAGQSLLGKVDMIYVPNDNTVASAFDSLVSITEQNKMPLFTSDENMLKSGGIATLGIDYFQLGYQTGDMAKRILAGESPSEMAIELQKSPKLSVNLAYAEKIGVTLDPKLLERADNIFK